MAKVNVNQVYTPSATAAERKVADKIARLYRDLIEELDARGVGNGVWDLEIQLPPNGNIKVILASDTGTLDVPDMNDIVIERRFATFGGNKVLENNLLRMGPGLQGKGLADIVNAVGVKAADIWGADRILLEANLDVGGYAWLRKGVWPNEGRTRLNRIVYYAQQENKLSRELYDKWVGMTDVELRAFVRTPAFREYREAFLGSHWLGWADLTDPETRALFTGAASRAAPKVAPAATANEIYRDAALRHQIGLRRYSAGLTARIARLLEDADADLVRMLRDRLARFEGKPIDFTGARWKALVDDIRLARTDVMKGYRELTRGELSTLGKLEGERELTLLQAAVPIETTFAAVAVDQLRAIVSSQPFQGRLLNDWFKELEANDQRRLVGAIQLGMVEGEPVDDIVRRVVGTRANGYTDGILSITRRDANAVVRTAVNHVSNAARGYVWDANDDIISARVWTSTLDGRTSAVCRARDGHGAAVGNNPLPAGIPPLVPKDARPPAHINCRSTTIAYIDGIGLVGRRPTVVDTRTRAKREIDFRKLAKQNNMSIQDVRADWARKVVGGVPATTNYQDFLSRQSASFQDEVLGQTKGRLFRQGGLKLDQFVDRSGNELSLAQLAATKPEVFKRAGLDPGAY